MVRAVHGRAATAIERIRGDLDRSLFLPSAPEALRLRGWEGGLALVAFVALTAALQFLRAGPTDSPTSLWAEDGPVFLAGTFSHGFLDAVTTTYAEYLVVMPRLIAEIGAAVPLADAPVAMNLAAVLVVALCGVAVWCAAAGHIRSTYLRALLVALAVLPPVSGLETVASATNVAWYSSFAVFWLLLWRPATVWGAGLSGLLILATGLSSPTIFFFAPLALLRAIAVRDRRDAIVAGSFALALAIQLPATVFSHEPVGDPLWTPNILTTFLQRVVDGSVLGLELGGSAWAAWGRPFLIAISLGVAAALVALARRASAGRLVAGIAVATSVAMFLGSAYKRALGDAMVWPEGVHNSLGGRYAVVPTLLLISAALVLVDSIRPARRGRPALAGAAATAVLLVAIVTSFDVSYGGARAMPPWDESLREGAAACRSRDISEVQVFISPEGWSMTVPCERLESEYEAAPAP